MPNINEIYQILDKYHVGIIQNNPKLRPLLTMAQRSTEHEKILDNAGYVWDEQIRGYKSERGYQYIFALPNNMFVWILGGMFKLLKTPEKLSIWVGGRSVLFAQEYLKATGEAEPIKVSGPATISTRAELEPVSKVHPIVAQIKRKYPSLRVPADTIIDLYKKASSEKDDELMGFVKQLQPLEESWIKRSQLKALLQEIVKGIVKEAYSFDDERWGLNQRSLDPNQKWLEYVANKLWKDPKDIGKGGLKWKLSDTENAKTGEKVYKLSKIQTVEQIRYFVNRAGKWYYFEPKARKWNAVPEEYLTGSIVPVNVDEIPPEEFEEPEEPDIMPPEGELEEMTATGAVSPISTPFAFKKKRKTMEQEATANALKEMTTTGAVTGYNIPGAFSRRDGGSEKGLKASERLGFKRTREGEKEFKRHPDKLFEKNK